MKVLRCLMIVVASIISIAVSAEELYFPISIPSENSLSVEYRITYDTDTKSLSVNSVGVMSNGLLPVYGEPKSIINTRIKHIYHTDNSSSIGGKGNEIVFVDSNNKICFGIYMDNSRSGKNEHHECYLLFPNFGENRKKIEACLVSDHIFQRWNKLYQQSSVLPSSYTSNKSNRDRQHGQSDKSGTEIMQYISHPFGVLNPKSFEKTSISNAKDIIYKETKLNLNWESGHGTATGIAKEPGLNIKICGQKVKQADIKFNNDYKEIDWSYLFFQDVSKEDAENFVATLINQLQGGGIAMTKQKEKDCDDFYEGNLKLNGHNAKVYVILVKKSRYDIWRTISISVHYKYGS